MAQKRVTTPGEAIADGADLVIGWQVTRGVDPRGEALWILDEIRATRSTRSLELVENPKKPLPVVAASESAF